MTRFPCFCKLMIASCVTVSNLSLSIENVVKIFTGCNVCDPPDPPPDPDPTDPSSFDPDCSKLGAPSTIALDPV